MERIKLGEIDSEYEVFARPSGFDMEFEVVEIESGVTNKYDNLLDLADDIYIANGQIGYYRLEAITKALLKGENQKLNSYERELLL